MNRNEILIGGRKRINLFLKNRVTMQSCRFIQRRLGENCCFAPSNRYFRLFKLKNLIIYLMYFTFMRAV